MTSAEEVKKPPTQQVVENVISDLLTTGGKRCAIDEAATLLRTLLKERDEARNKALDEAAEFLKNRAQIYRDEAHDQKVWGNRVAENGALVAARALANAVAPILALKDTQ